MSATRAFFDTNVLLYLLSGDAFKADRAERTIAQGGAINVQVLNEFASVAGRKFVMSTNAIREVLTAVRRLCTVGDLTIATHDAALSLVARYRFSFYDALIVAAALQANCRTLYSEDLQHGQVVEGLTIRNPFRR